MKTQKVTTDLAKGFHIYVQLILEYQNYIQRRFVTNVSWKPKEFEYDKGKKAHEFESLDTALEFCWACGINGYNASVYITHEANPDINKSNRVQTKEYHSQAEFYDESGNKEKEEN